MFNKFSSRLLSSGAAKRKSLQLRNSPAHENGTDLDDNDSVDSYSASYAASLFPIEASAADQLVSNFSFSSSAESTTPSENESKRSWPTSSSALPEEEINVGPAVLPDYEEAEEQFLEDYEDYFENLSVDNIRREQYPKLELQRIAHLDYANSPIFSRYQAEEHMRILLEEAPFSASTTTSSSRLAGYVPDVQERLLNMFNTSREEYSIIFTTGFSAGMRLFGDAYPFDRNSQLLVCQDTHEAVRHVVSSATKAGSRVVAACVRASDLCIPGGEIRRLLQKPGGGVFAFPAQSSLSGARHSLNWVAEAQQNGWHVLLDVSSYLPAGNLDLSLHQPEFVVGSLHHLLGYPSGLGFVLAKRQLYSVVQKNKVGFGNQVQIVAGSQGSDYHVIAEDENINLLTFAAMSIGLEHLESIGLDRIQKRVSCLSSWLYANLKNVKHTSGGDNKPLIKMYGPAPSKDRGSVIVFNLVDSTGNFFPPNIVRRLAEKNNIILGTCQMNQGLVSMSSRSPGEKALSAFTAVRVSLGLVSNFQDVYRFVQFLLRFRDEDYMSSEAMGFIEESH